MLNNVLIEVENILKIDFFVLNVCFYFCVETNRFKIVIQNSVSSRINTTN